MAENVEFHIARYLWRTRSNGRPCECCTETIPDGANVYFFPGEHLYGTKYIKPVRGPGFEAPQGTYACRTCAIGILNSGYR